MSRLREYVAGLNDITCKVIFAEHEAWERKGTLADGMLRTHTDEFLRLTANSQAGAFVIWADKMAAEVWRRFAKPALTDKEG